MVRVVAGKKGNNLDDDDNPTTHEQGEAECTRVYVHRVCVRAQTHSVQVWLLQSLVTGVQGSDGALHFLPRLRDTAHGLCYLEEEGGGRERQRETETLST